MATTIGSSLRPNQIRFLAAFGECGSLTQAARWSKLTRQAHYEWMAEGSNYPEAFAFAEKKASRTLRDEAIRRARDGVRKAVRHRGRIVGYETEFSDQLMMFLLKGLDPDTFASRTQLMGKDGGPIVTKISLEDAQRYFESMDE